MIPKPQVAVDPPLQFFARGPDGQLVDLAVEVAKDWPPQRVREANATFRRNLIRLEAHLAGQDARNAATAAQREAAQRRFVTARRLLMHVVAARPPARTAARTPRTAARRSSSSSSSSTSDDGGEPAPAEVRAAFARLRAAQAAFATDPQLAARLIQQAAQDLRGDAA